MIYVFVCNWGINRSETAKEVADRLARKRGVSLDSSFMALYPEDTLEEYERERQEMLPADLIFCMTKEIKKEFQRRYHLPDEKLILFHNLIKFN